MSSTYTSRNVLSNCCSGSVWHGKCYTNSHKEYFFSLINKFATILEPIIHKKTSHNSPVMAKYVLYIVNSQCEEHCHCHSACCTVLYSTCIFPRFIVLILIWSIESRRMIQVCVWYIIAHVYHIPLIMISKSKMCPNHPKDRVSVVKETPGDPGIRNHSPMSLYPSCQDNVLSESRGVRRWLLIPHQQMVSIVPLVRLATVPVVKFAWGTLAMASIYCYIQRLNKRWIRRIMTVLPKFHLASMLWYCHFHNSDVFLSLHNQCFQEKE